MMARIIIFILFIVVGLAKADAGYKSNYSDWRQTSPDVRGQYAMGLLDGQLLPSGGDNSAIARSVGLNECAFALELTGPIIAEAITKHYEDHTDMWGLPPIVVFQKVIVLGSCLSHINTERAKYGLEPWK